MFSACFCSQQKAERIPSFSTLNLCRGTADICLQSATLMLSIWEVPIVCFTAPATTALEFNMQSHKEVFAFQYCPLPIVHLPCLQVVSSFTAGTDHGSDYSIQTRSKTRMIQAATAAHGMEDTATSPHNLPHKAISRKRQRAGSSKPLPAHKKAAIAQAEDAEMPDVIPIPTAMEVDRPCTRAATRRKKVEKDRRQRKAWR